MIDSTRLSRRLIEGEYWFEATPRFGFSNDFSDLFSVQEVESKNYFNGLLLASLVTMSIFLVWVFFLMASRCCCIHIRRVGFVSGSPLRAVVATDKKETVANPWIRKARNTFTVACIGYLISAALVTAAMGRLDKAINSFVDGVDVSDCL
jgi:hypothetical protein